MPEKQLLTRDGRRVLSEVRKRLSDRRKSRSTRANQTSQKAVPEQIKRELIAKTDWRCHVCGRRIIRIQNVDIDHVRPRVHGGRDSVNNYLASCKDCNALRGRLHHSEIKAALAIGKWAMQQIYQQKSTGIMLANLYGAHLARRDKD